MSSLPAPRHLVPGRRPALQPLPADRPQAAGRQLLPVPARTEALLLVYVNPHATRRPARVQPRVPGRLPVRRLQPDDRPQAAEPRLLPNQRQIEALPRAYVNPRVTRQPARRRHLVQKRLPHRQPPPAGLQPAAEAPPLLPNPKRPGARLRKEAARKAPREKEEEGCFRRLTAMKMTLLPCITSRPSKNSRLPNLSAVRYLPRPDRKRTAPGLLSAHQSDHPRNRRHAACAARKRPQIQVPAEKKLDLGKEEDP